MTESEKSAGWTHVIEPASGWFDVHLSELWRYRDLILLLIKREFVSVYKRTILGPLWFLIQPLLTVLIFTVIFAEIIRIPTNGIPPLLFYLSGVVAWNYFSNCLIKTADTLSGYANTFGKVWFPRLAVPIGTVVSNLFIFGIQFLLFLSLYVFYFLQDKSLAPNASILILPLLILQMATLGLGLGILISSLVTKYRDLGQLVSFGVHLWMYATPVVFPASVIPHRLQWIVWVNPMAPIIETFRAIFFNGQVDVASLVISGAETLLILFIGILVFNRVEKNFMDTV